MDSSPGGPDSGALEQQGTPGVCHFNKPATLLIQGVLGPTLGSKGSLSAYVSRPVPESGVLGAIAACWVLAGTDLGTLLTWFMGASFLGRPLSRTPALGLGFQGSEDLLTHRAVGGADGT